MAVYQGVVQKLQRQRLELQRKQWNKYDAFYKKHRGDLADTQTHISHLVFQSVAIPTYARELQSLGTCLQGALHKFECHVDMQRQLSWTQFLKKYIQAARRIAEYSLVDEGTDR